MQSYYTFIALDLANERSRETQRRRLLDIARASDPEQPSSFRRSAAALVATISRASGRLARRLDEDANIGEALIGRSIADGCN